MPRAFFNEQTVEAEGETLRLVLNFRSLDATESLLGKSFTSILGDLQQPDPPLGLLGKVVWGLLREHHPEVGLDQTASLLFGETGIKVGYAVSQLLNAAFPVAEEGEQEENPPEPRGTLEPS